MAEAHGIEVYRCTGMERIRAVVNEIHDVLSRRRRKPKLGFERLWRATKTARHIRRLAERKQQYASTSKGLT